MVSQKRFGTRQVLGRVDADGFHLRDTDLDMIACLQPSQLLQALSHLERRLRQRGNFAEHIRPIGIQTDVLVEGVSGKPFRGFDTTKVGNHASTEIEGAVIVIHDHLRTIGIAQCLKAVLCSERFHEGGDLCGGVLETGLDGLQLLWLNEWLITLYVHDDVEGTTDAFVSLLHTVGAAFVVHTRHHSLSAECQDGVVDALVIGSHDGFVQLAFHLTINPFNDCLAAEHSQRLGRETRGSVTGWNNSYESHVSNLFLVLNLCVYLLLCTFADEMKQHIYYIGVGTNLPDGDSALQWAHDQLVSLVRGSLLVSSSRLTEPIGLPDSGPFTNQLIRLETALDAEELRLALKALERRFGRMPEDKARGIVKLDLDILCADGQVLKADEWQRSYMLAARAELD